MADTVVITSGAASTLPDGTVIATDDAGAAGQVQIVKLAYATDGVATAIPGDVNGLLVNVGAAVPGTGATALGKAIDSAGGATDTGVAVLAIRDDALTTLTPIDGDYVALRVGSTGALHATLATVLDALVGDSIAIKSPTAQVKKSFNATTTQTGADVWDPAASMKIRVSTLIIGTYGTTAGRLILWFGANADTTYTEGTDEALFKASFAPSATVSPGAVVNFTPPFECATVDYELHITTDANLSVDVVVVGYEEA